MPEGRVHSKVALITGAARGQGRSHALRLAAEGANIIALDACADIDSVPYALANRDELEETAEIIRKVGRRVVTRQVDVRDSAGLAGAVEAGVAELGRVDIVCANAGILSFGEAEVLSDAAWEDVLDINLTGAWRTCKVAIPYLRQAGGGSIVLTSSTAGLKGNLGLAHYSASKHGLVGLMRTLAKELAGERIRVNTVHPTTVPTVMVLNRETYKRFRPDLDAPTLDDALPGFVRHNLLDVPWVEPIDVSNVVLFLASDESRYVTGSTIVVERARRRSDVRERRCLPGSDRSRWSTS
jgi:(+)-trans-carveol dehydrogenase